MLVGATYRYDSDRFENYQSINYKFKVPPEKMKWVAVEARKCKSRKLLWKPQTYVPRYIISCEKSVGW